jgi:hypothetical protein
MKATDQMPMCCNCKRATPIPLTPDVLCKIYGVVSANYSCKKYSYNYFLQKPKRKRNIDKNAFCADDFSIED